MRTVSLSMMAVSLLVLGGCSLLDHTSSSENVRTAYAGTTSMNAQQVRQLLHDQGYTNVKNLHRDGDDWLGSATTSTGTSVNFDLDKNGKLHMK